MAKGPSPEQQADYLVRKLEQTIRDNRTVRNTTDKREVRGMSFSTWQTVAREEIANALRAAERRRAAQGRAVALSVLATAASLVTIGFWGAVVAVDRAWGSWAAFSSLGAGLILAGVGARWGVTRMMGNLSDHLRTGRLAKIEDLDRRIKRMETDMQKKHDRLKDKMAEVGDL